MKNSKNLLFLRRFKFPLKKVTMKKLFAILAISATVVACNNAGENKSTTDSTSTTTVDTTTMKSAMDSSATPMADTLHHDTTTVKHDTTTVKH